MSPMGPGFFIFFRSQKGSGRAAGYQPARKDKKKEEEEIILFLKVILTKGLL